MAHLHNIYDSDIHFKLDYKTRLFSNETELKLLVAQGDHNSERFTFEIPRYIEQHDMLKCNRIEIHYINISSTTRDTSKDVYIVDDAQVSPEDENVVEFSWLLSGHATQYNGTLSFAISMKCLTDEVIDYRWNTLTYEKILVGKSLNNAETIAQEYSDVLEKWKKEVLENINPTVTIDTELNEKSDNAIANSTVTKKISQLSDSITKQSKQIDEAVANYLAENPVSGGLTATAKNLLITILRNALYNSNQSENITALETALGQSSSDTTVYYSITNTLTNVTNNNSNTQVLENTSYIASLSANNGYTLESITVTMGGIDITSSVYADGVITVSSVTGDIIITANAIISTTSNAELITDGLLAYVDGRTCTYNNSNSNGATTIIPNQGSGQFFAWAKDGVEVQDEYGLHFANNRNHVYDKDGGTNQSDLGTQFTVVHLTKGNVGFGSEFKNVPPYWKFKPYYITTSGSRMDITDSSSYNGDSKDDYNFMVYRVDGTKLTQIMDTSRVDRDGSTIDGFASWNAKVDLGMQEQNADGMYVTAFAVYNRALSDVEIEEMRAFFKTLEVSA